MVEQLLKQVLMTFVVSVSLVCSASSDTTDKQERLLSSALSNWLEGEEVTALTEIRSLAVAGHSTSRLVLARIESTSMGQSNEILSLTKQERKALFRDTSANERFPQSWLLTEAEQGNNLAKLLIEADFPNVSLPLIKQLIDLGEVEAVNHQVRIAALYGSETEKNALWEQGLVPEEIKPFVRYLSSTPEPQGDGAAVLRIIADDEGELDLYSSGSHDLAASGLLALGFGYAPFPSGNNWIQVIEKWLAELPGALPLQNACRETCPTDTQCLSTLLWLIGGYYEMTRLDTPLESALPQKDFLNSTRAKDTVLRWAAQARTELWELPELSEIKVGSQCLAEKIGSLRQEALQQSR